MSFFTGVFRAKRIWDLFITFRTHPVKRIRFPSHKKAGWARLHLRRSLPRIKVLLTRAILCNFLYVKKINETAFLSSVHRAILPLPILSYPVSAVNSRAYIIEQHTLLHHYFIICNWLTLQALIALRLCLTTDLLLHAYYTAIHEKYKCPTGFFRSRLSAPRLPVHSFSNGHSLLA